VRPRQPQGPRKQNERQFPPISFAKRQWGAQLRQGRTENAPVPVTMHLLKAIRRVTGLISDPVDNSAEQKQKLT
jgi:hypothetical protein